MTYRLAKHEATANEQEMGDRPDQRRGAGCGRRLLGRRCVDMARPAGPAWKTLVAASANSSLRQSSGRQINMLGRSRAQEFTAETQRTQRPHRESVRVRLFLFRLGPRWLGFQLDLDQLDGFITDVFRLVLHRWRREDLSSLHMPFRCLSVRERDLNVGVGQVNYYVCGMLVHHAFLVRRDFPA